jgi:hypothetical protein
VKHPEAQAISRSLSSAYDSLESAFEEFGKRTSSEAAELCGYYLTDAYIQLGLRVVNPLWEEYPDLNPRPGDPVALPPSPVAQLTRADLQPVLSAIANLGEAVTSCLAMAEAGAASATESLRYRESMLSVRDALGAAETSLGELVRSGS